MRTSLAWDVLFVHRARRSAPRARRRALSPGAAAAPHADHARSRLPRRSQVSSRTKRRRAGADGADAGRVHPAAETPRPRGAAHRASVPWPEHADDPLPLEGRKLHVHVDWDGPMIVLAEGRRGAAGPRPQRRDDRHRAGRIAAIEPGAVDLGPGHDHRRQRLLRRARIHRRPRARRRGARHARRRRRRCGIAARLPRYGVTAFCPTTVACPPRRAPRRF